MKSLVLLSIATSFLLVRPAHADADADANSFVQAALGVGRTTELSGMAFGNDVETEPVGLLGLSLRLSSRWSWMVPSPAFAYRGGTLGEREVIPVFGLLSWGAGFSSIEGTILQGTLGAGVTVRERVTSWMMLNLGAMASSPMMWTSGGLRENRGPDSWRTSASIGASLQVGALELNAGVSVGQWLLADGDWTTNDEERGRSVALGSVQTAGFRRLPLVAFPVSERVTLEGHAILSYEVSDDEVVQTYLGGATWTW